MGMRQDWSCLTGAEVKVFITTGTTGHNEHGATASAPLCQSPDRIRNEGARRAQSIGSDPATAFVEARAPQ